MENKYTVIKKESLAKTINFLTGFKYYIFTDGDEKKFSFENTEEFNLALHKILQFRNDLRKEIEA